MAPELPFHWAFILLGSNDSKLLVSNQPQPQTPIEPIEYFAYLGALVSKLESDGFSRITLLGAPPQPQQPPEVRQRLVDYRAWQIALARRSWPNAHVELGPDFSGMQAQMLPDGIHPNQEGHQRMADEILAFIGF